MPPTYFGVNPSFDTWPEMNWLSNLPQNTFFSLWLRNPILSPLQLPLGHPLYVISFHYEPFDYEWVQREASRVSAPVIILNDGDIYDTTLPPNCFFYNYISWHQHIDQIRKWFPYQQPRNPKHKISAICNRITTYKLVAFTALAEYLGVENNIVKLGTWLEEQHVNHRRPLHIPELN